MNAWLPSRRLEWPGAVADSRASRPRQRRLRRPARAQPREAVRSLSPYSGMSGAGQPVLSPTPMCSPLSDRGVCFQPRPDDICRACLSERRRQAASLLDRVADGTGVITAGLTRDYDACDDRYRFPPATLKHVHALFVSPGPLAQRRWPRCHNPDRLRSERRPGHADDAEFVG